MPAPLTPPATIAFIGLGMMGKPMAGNLIAAGYRLRVYDASQQAMSDFVGTHPAALATASAKAAAEGADALITMLPDGKIVRHAVLDGPNCAAQGLARGRIVIDVNAWPSFALYREAAADRIAAHLAARLRRPAHVAV